MHDIPFYPGYKLTDDLEIIGKKGLSLSKCKTETHLFVNVYVNRKPTILYIHRAVALVFVDGYFEEAWVDHIDNNPLNNSPKNLRWVTPKENGYNKKNKLEIVSKRIERLRSALRNLESHYEDLLREEEMKLLLVA